MAKKYALLIGTDRYEDSGFSPLTVPKADVESLQRVLKNPQIGGFDRVDTVLNGALDQILAAIGDLFGDKAQDDLLLVYFSGHAALDAAGQLHLAVAKTKPKRLGTTALWSTVIKKEMNDSRSRRQLLILDCCYAGAFSRNTAGSKSAIAEPAVNEATFDVKGYGREILVSSSATQRSWEGDRIIGSSDKSLFTHYLVQGLEGGKAAPEGESEITVGQLYNYVHGKVVSASPVITPQRWVEAQTDAIVLARNPNPVTKTMPLPDDILNDLEDVKPHVREGAVRELGRLVGKEDRQRTEAVIEILQARRTSERDRFVYQEIERVLLDLKDSSDVPRKAIEFPVNEPEVYKSVEPRQLFRDTLKDSSKGPEMVVIPADSYQMGDIQGNGDDEEKPVHKVTIERPFAMGKFPLTFAEYDHYCDKAKLSKPNDEDWGRGDRPVINVSWKEATAYVEWLSDQTGKTYRLPSEAEWEYAARGGTETEYWWGDEADKNYANFAGKQTTPVRQFEANPFGLHDILGNVWEWVQDSWHKNYNSAPIDGSAWVIGLGWFDKVIKLRVIRAARGTTNRGTCVRRTATVSPRTSAAAMSVSVSPRTYSPFCFVLLPFSQF